MNIQIAPSILSADFGQLAQQIQAVESAGADMIHIDVMDGQFVPNITIGPLVVKAARNATKLPLDVHLMIERPDGHIRAFVDAGADIISVHDEACVHLHRTIQNIKSLGVKACVAYNPATPVASLHPVIDMLDMVLIMSVNPGFGGQRFIESVLPKINEVRNIISASGRNIDLQVDGGVAPDTTAQVKAAGANVLVAGSAVYGTPDYAVAIKTIREG